MCPSAVTALYTLDDEGDEGAENFQMPLVMPIAGQASPVAAFTLHHMGLKAIYNFIIGIL